MYVFIYKDKNVDLMLLKYQVTSTEIIHKEIISGKFVYVFK